MTTTATFDFESKFCIHFVTTLFGGDRQKLLDNDWKNNDIPLYWRTPLLRHAKEEEVCLLFVDVSMKYSNNTDNNDADNSSGFFQIFIGAFRKWNNTYYYSTARLNERAVKSHFESLSIDVETTAPSILAKSMARALLLTTHHEMNKTPTTTRNCQCDDNEFSETSISFPLQYEDILQEEKKNITLDIESNSKLDAATASMILSNISNYNTDPGRNGGNEDNGTESCDDPDEFEKLLLRRLVLMHQNEEQTNVGEKVHQSKPASEQEVEKDSTKQQHKSTRITASPANKPLSRVAACAMRSRRKKAKTLSYSKS